MVCFFCIAVFALVAGALAASSIDQIEEQLDEKSADGVRRVSDTESVARFELTVEIDRKKTGVVVTVYKEHSRVRIQILSHELSPEQVQRLQDELAEAIGAEVVNRSHPETADHEHPEEDHAEPDPERERERAAAEPAEAARERERERPDRR